MKSKVIKLSKNIDVDCKGSIGACPFSYGYYNEYCKLDTKIKQSNHCPFNEYDQIIFEVEK